MTATLSVLLHALATTYALAVQPAVGTLGLSAQPEASALIGLAFVAVTALAAVLVAHGVMTHAARASAGPPQRLSHARTLPGSCAQNDPDTDARPRPRAPGSAATAA